ncbi:rho GDP-dissociation inhibitor 1-like [Populus alba x Populus x berolinensis]|uniref:Rho GDP-dissociation inhibitor 1-like n=1 Tax=Populus alba x Populus x berolinensis TaxID=444605 RepID=A0AAD6RHE3_9ROSI|nr:rho GDP-dissociation inhibitor 1-like [Populus alba x Populus x berolinensis]
MSAAVRTRSASQEVSFSNEMENLGLNDHNIKAAAAAAAAAEEEAEKGHEEDDSVDDIEDDGSKLQSDHKELDLGPQDDDSLRRWKEQLLGSVDMSAVGESKEPEVKILSLSILCPGRPDLVLPFPFNSNSKSSSLFTLKEGSLYHLKLCFTVSNNLVSGLKYTNTVWKTGVRVDRTKVMLGTFSPQKEPYRYELEEETTPSGIFARGSYSARTKIVDDDGKCYLDVSYCFEIQKRWPSS